jgi:hypothetical protein
MQAIATYLMLMLTIVEVGLSVIFAGVLCVGFYEAAAWLWSRVEQKGESLAPAGLAR